MPIVSFFRSAAPTLRALFAAGATLAAAFAQSPSAADGFDPNVDGNVYALSAQPDGRLILGGQFATLHPGVGPSAFRNNLARVNVDGSVDLGFDPNANGAIRSVVLQPDGKLLVGGDFTTIAGVARTRLARLNADGSLDTTFNTGTINGSVNAILVLPDGRVVIGGGFTAITPTPTGPSFQRGRIARLSATGALDTAFNPNFNNIVFALALHGGGKILVGGAFTSMQPAGATAPTGRGRFARLNPDGTPDSEFDGGANNSVYAIAVQRDGKILLGGAFTTVMPIPTPTPQPRAHLARMQPDGQFDSSFIGGTNSDVNALIVHPDGSILAGGAFSTAFGNGTGPAGRSFVARFSPEGALDVNFTPALNQVVSALALMPDGKLAAGGYFTRAGSRGVPAGVVRNRLARFHNDGALDTTFVPDDAGRPLHSLVQSDGKVVIAGTFTTVGGVTRNFLARLNADGSLDTAFNPNLNGVVHALALQSDGKILVGGLFTSAGGTTRNHLARLNPNGTVDTAFDPGPDGAVEVIALQSDGKILIGGGFSSLAYPIAATSTTSATTTTTRNRIARINADGTLDTAFDPSANNNVLAIAVQTDGKILVGGSFTTFTPNSTATKLGTTTARRYLARLNADATVDTAYDPSPNSAVSAIALQSDGKAIVGGAFTNFPIPNVAITATVTTTPRNRLARVNADGTIDSGFDPNANSLVNTVVVQSDGKILAGGSFTTLTPNGAANWTQRKYAARLNTDGTIDATFNLDLNEQAGNNVTEFRLQSDGKILMCGGFTSLQPLGATTRTARSHFVRLNAAGTLDTAFNPGAGGASAGTINAIAVQTDGRIVVAGQFADLGGAGTTNLARFNAEGTLDPTFGRAIGGDGAINAVALRPDTSGLTPQLPGFAWLSTTGTALTNFRASKDVDLSGTISVFAFQKDGSLLLGGTFTNLAGVGTNLIRLSASGTLDTSFDPRPNGTVNLITIQNDGRILLGGTFTAFAPKGGDSITRNHVARLALDGTVERFDPNPNGNVTAIIEQPNGQILLAGQFTSLTPNAVTATTTETATTKTGDVNSTKTVNNSDGSTTTTTITVGGGTTTTTITTTSGGVATTRNFLARVTTDGDLDPNFQPNPGGFVNGTALQADGKIVVGGTFTSVAPTTVTTGTGGTAGTTTKTNGDGTTTTTTVSIANNVTTTTVTTTYTRNYLARFNADGTVDTAYDPNLNANVYALVLQPDGKILVGGEFTKVGTTPRNNLARINPDNGVDATFDPNANGSVRALALQPDGRILASGTFTTFQPAGGPAVPRDGFARLTAAGALDSTFDPVPNGSVTAFAARADGTVLLAGAFTAFQPGGVMFVGGAFANVGGIAANNLAALNNDGSANSSFAPNPNGAVNAILFQPDGKLVVGGAFTQIAGATRNRIARFNVDGTLDAAFNPNANGTINALAIQPDGRIFLGGAFTAVGGVARNNVALISSAGAVDGSFTPAVSNPATAIALESGGSLLVVSAISSTRSAIQQLNAATGQTVTSFNNTADGLISSLTTSADGSIFVAGTFTSVSGSTFTPLNPGGGSGTISSVSGSRIARLFAVPQGIPDTAFNPAPDAAVTALALQADGRAIMGGAFKNVGGLARSGLARVAAAGTARQSLSIAAGTGAQRNIVWTRDGTSMELSSVRFDVSSDARTWTTLTANAQRATGGRGWQSGNVAVSLTDPFYVRVRGLVASGTGTSGVIEQVQQFNLSASASFAGTAAGLVAGAVIDAKTGQALYVQTSSAGNGDFPAGVAASDSGSGTPVTPTAPPVVTVGGDLSARLANLSVRARVTTASPLITGFAISGSTSRTVLLRGVGPSLGVFGVSTPLAQPRLQLFDGSGKLLLENNGWAATPTSVAEVGAATARTGAFPFAANSGNDAALAVTLAPGTYSMQVQDRGGTGGIALAEIYDADTATTSKLVNISSRSTVAAGDGAFISGFVIAGNTSRTLLVRGLGPALAQFGVTGTLGDPVVSVYDASGRLVTANDNWSNATPDGSVSANTAVLTAASAQVAAFPLTVGSTDAALSISLPPGAYTVQVSGPAATATGAAMLEVYELP